MSQPYGMPWQQPPYAVPPIPTGFPGINPAAWNKGNWTANPNYQPTSSQPAQAWVPNDAWAAHRPPQIPQGAQGHPSMQQQQQQQPQQQQQQQEPYNPYKKQYKPPSAEYLATEIGNNGLQLSGMQDRRALGWGHELAPTPWRWDPALPEGDDEDEDDEDEDEGESTDQDSSSSSEDSSPSPSPSRRRPRFQEPVGHVKSRRTTPPRPPTPSASTTRRLSPSAPSRNPEANNGSRGVSSASASAAALNRGQSSSSSANVTPSRQTSVPEAYTSKTPLKPTFSPGIIRTPEYYRQTPSRSGSVSNTPMSSAPPSRRGSGESMRQALERLSNGEWTSSTSTLGRQSSLPVPLYVDPAQSRHRPSLSGTGMVEEPTEMLSPLIIDSTPKPGSRPLGRGASMPTSMPSAVTGGNPLARIREVDSPQSFVYPGSSSTSSPYPPKRSGSRSKRESDPSSGSHSHSSAHPPHSTNSRHHGNTPPSTDHSHQTTPPSSVPNGPYAHNPLPRPPQESTYLNGLYAQTSSSASASAAAAAAHPSYQPRASSSASTAARQHTSSSSRARRQSSKTPSPPDANAPIYRRGYWNSRGDHLVGEEIVYAPDHKAHPPELSNYPEPLQGFRDHKGEFEPYSANRREYPDSLPQRGKPPRKPYESFIEYVN